MLTLKINKTFVQIPSTVSEISLATGVELMHMTEISNPTYNDKLSIISSISNIDVLELNKFTTESIEAIYSKIDLLHVDEFMAESYKTFILNNIEYGLIDYNSLTVHEYADIDFYINESTYNLENLDKLMTILYRPISNKKQTLKNILKNILFRLISKNVIPQIYKEYNIKKYDEGDLKRSEYFAKHLNMGFCINAYIKLIEVRKQIADSYPTLFNPEIDEKDKDQYDDVSVTPLIKTHSQIWGMQHLIASVSNSLFERDAWLNKPIKEFLLYLSYFNNKIISEQQIK